MNDRILNIDDVSKMFNVSSKTIQRLRKKGLPYFISDNKIRFLQSDILKYADEKHIFLNDLLENYNGIIDQYNCGKTIKEISENLKISRRDVYKTILKEKIHKINDFKCKIIYKENNNDDKDLFKQLNYYKCIFNNLRYELNKNNKIRIIRKIHNIIKRINSIKTLIICEYKKLLVHIVKKIKKYDFQDMLSDGYLILLNCIDTFDYRKNIPFKNYLSFSLKKRYIRYPRKNYILVGKYPEVLYNNSLSCIDATDELDKYLKCLNEREKSIILHRFGFFGKNTSYLDVSKKFKISKERVIQITRNSIEKMREINYGKKY